MTLPGTKPLRKLSELVKSRRGRRNISFWARQMGVSAVTIRELEAGNPIHRDEERKIAKFFDLLTGEYDPPPLLDETAIDPEKYTEDELKAAVIEWVRTGEPLHAFQDRKFGKFSPKRIARLVGHWLTYDADFTAKYLRAQEVGSYLAIEKLTYMGMANQLKDENGQTYQIDTPRLRVLFSIMKLRITAYNSRFNDKFKDSGGVDNTFGDVLEGLARREKALPPPEERPVSFERHADAEPVYDALEALGEN